MPHITHETTGEDVRAFRNDSLLVIYPLTAEAVDWFDDNTEWEPSQRARGVVVCEHRYGPDLLMGAYQSGLSVSLDGVMADADLADA